MAVHQLRYVLAFGGGAGLELQRQGHSYLHSLAPWAILGPGRVAQTVTQAGYRLTVPVSPNKAAAPDSFALRITRNGRPLRHADVTLTFNHTEMEMPQQEYQLTETRPGVYSRSAPALIMVGPWSLAFQITPPGGRPFQATVLDEADG